LDNKKGWHGNQKKTGVLCECAARGKGCDLSTSSGKNRGQTKPFTGASNEKISREKRREGGKKKKRGKENITDKTRPFTDLLPGTKTHVEGSEKIASARKNQKMREKRVTKKKK